MRVDKLRGALMRIRLGSVVCAFVVVVSLAIASSAMAVVGGESTKPAADILADAKAELSSSASVRVSSVDDGYSLVMSYLGPKRAKLFLKHNGEQVHFTRVGKFVYLKANRKYWHKTVGLSNKQARILAKHWVREKFKNKDLDAMRKYLSLGAFANKTFVANGLEDTVTTTIYNDIQVAVISDKTGDLYVQDDDDAPRPLAIKDTAGNVVATFDRYDESIKINEPDEFIAV
jgi:hypothetical protein